MQESAPPGARLERVQLAGHSRPRKRYDSRLQIVFPLRPTKGPMLELPIETRLGALARALHAGEHDSWLHPLQRIEASPPNLGSRPSEEIEAGRGALALALRQRNEQWGHPGARARASRLADPDCLVVVAGQQPGFLGGPQLVLSKLLTAVAWARHLEAESGQPAEAVFWIASEDHDWDEVSHAYLPLAGCQARLSLGEDREPQRMLGRRSLDERAREAIAGCLRDVSPGDRARLEQISEIYAPGVNWTDAFARLLVARLGEDCPLLLDACDPAIKHLQAEALAALAERGERIDQRLGEREGEIIRAQLRPQVNPQPGWSLLFEHKDGCRHRIGWADDETYILRGREERGERGELAQRIRESPEDFSPTALGRPAVQDALLGSRVFVVGPGEFGYMAQASVVYDVLEIPAPRLALRPQLLITDARRAEQICELGEDGIGLEALLSGGELLASRLAARARREEDQQAIERLLAIESSLRQQAGELAQAGEALGDDLARACEKTREHLCRGLDALQRRVEAQLARSDEELKQRVDNLRQELVPENTLQERLVAWLALDAKWSSRSRGGTLGEVAGESPAGGGPSFAGALLDHGVPLRAGLFVLTPEFAS